MVGTSTVDLSIMKFTSYYGLQDRYDPTKIIIGGPQKRNVSLKTTGHSGGKNPGMTVSLKTGSQTPG